MCKKINLMIILILGFAQAGYCQGKGIKQKNSFLAEKKQLFYNGKKIFLGMPVKAFAEIVNSPYRTAKYSISGHQTTFYYWVAKKICVTQSKGYLSVEALKIDKATGNFYPQSEENKSKTTKYKSLNEVIKKYGKYDSLYVENFPGVSQLFYVWDKLGFNVSVHDSTIGQINLYPIHFKKRTIEYRLRKAGPPMPKTAEYMETEDKFEVENYKVMLERQPKTEFTGTFTYNGNTADFSKIGYAGWDDMVKALHIEDSAFNPPGDSKGWGKKIWLDYNNCLIDIKRYNNEEEYREALSPDKLGKINGVQSIEIWRFTDEDRK